MKPFIQYLLLVLMIEGCSSIQVTSDYDASVDFSKYKTLTYYGWSDNSDKVLNRFDKDRLEKSFAKELADRGLSVVSENGDAVISLFIVVDQKTSYTSYTDHYGMGAYGGMYDPRFGYYGAPMGSVTRTQQNDYLEGTLIVDVFDAKEKKQVWQGIGKKIINENTKHREENIEKAVAEIMKQFPIKALSK